MQVHWFDQPPELDDATELSTQRVSSICGRYYIAQKGAIYYVLVGNLFGSQTVECANYDVVRHVVWAIKAGQRNQKLPPLARLMENASPELEKQRKELEPNT